MEERAQRANLLQSVSSALKELKEILRNVYSDRLPGLYLYGSYARGDFSKHSDIDLLIALEGEVKPFKEIDRLSEIVSDLCLRHGLLIALYPVPPHGSPKEKAPFSKTFAARESFCDARR
jgi:predicted nucleotidyltransferase